MNNNIILSGVGGQGIVLASRLISDSALSKGISVMSAETIGMAQRGGSVFSHIRMGDSIYSPMIAEREADLIIGFEPAEAVRMINYLKPDGSVVVSDRAVRPVTVALSGVCYSGEAMIDYLRRHVQNLLIVNADKALKEVGSAKVLNLILLGAAAEGGALGISRGEIKEAIIRIVPEKFHELNFRALGYFKKGIKK